ncbi:MAG: AI-2E family transporter [Sporichthyaceae bacterium]
MTPRPDIWHDGLGRTATRSAQLLLVLALVVALVFVGVQLRLVVVPLLIAAVIAAALAPVVTWLHGRGLPRAGAVWITLLSVLGLLGGMTWLVVDAVRDEWDELRTQATEGFAKLQGYLTDRGLDEQQIADARSSLGEFLAGPDLKAGAITGVTLAVEIVAGIFLGLVLLYFLLKDGARIWAFLCGFLPPRYEHRYDLLAERSVVVLGGYARGTAIIALVDAVVIGATVAILGVPLALPLAVLVFLGAFVPLVGATVTGAMAALVALVAEGPVKALIVLAVVIAVNQLEGDVLAPIVLGRSVSLHPLAILLALSGGTVVAGIIGAILSVPLTAVIWSVIKTWRETAGTGGSSLLSATDPAPKAD